MKRKPNPKKIHVVLMRQGGYTLTPFPTLAAAEMFVWEKLSKHHNRKFAILRNHDNTIVRVFNDPRWKELRQFERLKNGKNTN